MTNDLSPQFYAEKAKNELNETEARKTQSLQQLKDRLAKHPFIKSEITECFMLAVLRSTKYSVDKAFERIEKNVVALKTTPEYQLPIEVLRKKNICYVLKKRDKDGCRVFLVDPSKVPVEDVNMAEMAFSMFSTNLIIAHENETQISGLKMIFDMRKLTMAHVKKTMTVNTISLMSHYNFSFLRVKSLTFVGLPSYAVIISESILSILSEKLRKRVHFVNNLDHEILDDDIEDVRKRAFEDEIIKKILNVEVDSEAMKNFSQSEYVGSFRKLDID